MYFSQDSVTTHLRCCGILNCHYTFTAESADERILKITHHFGEVISTSRVSCFLGSRADLETMELPWILACRWDISYPDIIL